MNEQQVGEWIGRYIAFPAIAMGLGYYTYKKISIKKKEEVK